METDAPHLCYLCQTLAWMGYDRAWTGDMIAEQLGDFDDPRIRRDILEAVRLRLVVEDDSGYRLTDAGMSVAAGG